MTFRYDSHIITTWTAKSTVQFGPYTGDSKMAIQFKWSEQNYKGLTPKQHAANNQWFKQFTQFLKPGGTIRVPNLGKEFDTSGKQI